MNLFINTVTRFVLFGKCDNRTLWELVSNYPPLRNMNHSIETTRFWNIINHYKSNQYLIVAHKVICLELYLKNFKWFENESIILLWRSTCYQRRLRATHKASFDEEESSERAAWNLKVFHYAAGIVNIQSEFKNQSQIRFLHILFYSFLATFTVGRKLYC